MLAFFLLIPLLVAMAGVAFNRNSSFSKYLALEGSIVALLLFPFVSGGTASFGWFYISGFEIAITASVNQLNWLLILIVLLIGPLIFAYSFDFMDLPSEQRRYYLEMLAFEAAMLTFAMAGNFILFFIAWEFLSLTSYLLIGFWYSRDRAIRAARKTITMILIGDLALLGAIVIFQFTFGTLEFSTIISEISSGGLGAASAAFLLLIAIMTKSAQFPFQEWLPDAMEGPTPVSAYLHSTTMVKAGVFAAIVLFPIFSAANYLGAILAVGMLTAILGMFNAMREKQVKRVLAYSTVQELGLMLVAVGGNAILAAVYFFVAQSFYKALLFFTAGVSMKATDKEDITKMSGLSKNKLIYFTALFGVLALAGFIPFDGFFANASLDSAFSTNLTVYVLLSLINFGTSFYIFRWFTMLSKKSDSERTALSYGLVGRGAVLGMVLLALATLAASAAFFILPGQLTSLGFANQTSLSFGTFEAGVELGAVVIGSLAAYLIYKEKRKSKKPVETPKIFDIVYSAGIMTIIYDHFAAFVETLADALAYFDLKLNEFFDAIGYLTVGAGKALRKLASGEINFYVGIFVVGLLLLVILVAVL